MAPMYLKKWAAFLVPRQLNLSNSTTAANYSLKILPPRKYIPCPLVGGGARVTFRKLPFSSWPSVVYRQNYPKYQEHSGFVGDELVLYGAGGVKLELDAEVVQALAVFRKLLV